jgi:hypothetical protein
MKDRRRKIRIETGSKASVRVDAGFATRSCEIENQSEDGVCLKMESPQFLEDRFLLLSLGKGGPARACRVKWRRRKLVGAMFVSSDDGR